MQMIREANLADAMAIAMVQVDSWRTTYAGIVPQEYLDALSYEQRATVLRTILSATAQIQFVYVAECDGGKCCWLRVGRPSEK